MKIKVKLSCRHEDAVLLTFQWEKSPDEMLIAELTPAQFDMFMNHCWTGNHFMFSHYRRRKDSSGLMETINTLGDGAFAMASSSREGNVITLRIEDRNAIMTVIDARFPVDGFFHKLIRMGSYTDGPVGECDDFTDRLERFGMIRSQKATVLTLDGEVNRYSDNFYPMLDFAVACWNAQNPGWKIPQFHPKSSFSQGQVYSENGRTFVRATAYNWELAT